MYKWEKIKYTYPQQSRVQTQEIELSEEFVNKLKRHILKFYKKGPADIKEFLYGWERKKYFKGDMMPRLKELIGYMDTTCAFVEC